MAFIRLVGKDGVQRGINLDHVTDWEYEERDETPEEHYTRLMATGMQADDARAAVDSVHRRPEPAHIRRRAAETSEPVRSAAQTKADQVDVQRAAAQTKADQTDAQRAALATGGPQPAPSSAETLATEPTPEPAPEPLPKTGTMRLYFQGEGEHGRCLTVEGEDARRLMGYFVGQSGVLR